MDRIKLTGEDMMVVHGDENGGFDYKLQFCSLEGYECQWKKEQAEQLKQQILDDHQIMNEFEQGWKDIGKYMRDNKISRGKLIGENLLLHNKLEKIEKVVSDGIDVPIEILQILENK